MNDEAVWTEEENAQAHRKPLDPNERLAFEHLARTLANKPYEEIVRIVAENMWNVNALLNTLKGSWPRIETLAAERKALREAVEKQTESYIKMTKTFEKVIESLEESAQLAREILTENNNVQ